MNDFLDEARNLYFGLNEKDRESFDRVLHAISRFSRVHSKSQLDLVNLETVFSTFEMARLLNKMPGDNPISAADLINDLKRLIVVTLERSIKLNVSGNGGILPPDEYVNFTKLLSELIKSGRKGSVITFNYDVLCDLAFQQEGLNLRYCLTDSEIETGPDFRLLKLHGSLNWAVRGKIIEPQDRAADNFFSGSSIDVRVNIGTSISQRTEFEPSPFLVPPTWNKGDHYDKIQPVWKAAAQELGKADNIFVIGFSMPETDSFFHYLYALGSEGEKQLRRFCVFNPDKNVMGRFERLLGPGALKRFKPYVGDDGYFVRAVSGIRKELSIPETTNFRNI